VATGAPINTRSFVTSDKPILYWFYAPL
jgi:hypothetical protein